MKHAVKITLLVLLMLGLVSAVDAQTKFRPATALTGGGTGALDKISVSDLNNGDAAIVVTPSYTYVYYFDATATDAESPPIYIRPDDYTTQGVWKLVDFYGTDLSVDADNNLLAITSGQVDLDVQSPNYFFAGPSTGVDTGKPTFRTIVAGDLPAASATGIGAVELATTVEVVTGTDPERVVTPEGVTARLAAPGPIGGTTPAAGTFTTLEAASGAFEVDADGNVEGKSFLATKASGVAGKIWAYEANSTDTSKTGFEGPANTSADLYFKFSNDEPTVGQAMRFGAPSSNVSQISWYNPEATQTGTHASPSTTNPLAPTWAGPMHVIWYNTSGEIDLPAASGYAGKGLIIYNMGSNTITVDPNGSEVIVRDGTAQSGGVSFTLSSGAGNYVGLFCDGARWITLGYKGTLAEGS